MTTVYVPVCTTIHLLDLNAIVKEIHDLKVQVSKLESDFTTTSQTSQTRHNKCFMSLFKENQQLRARLSRLEHELKFAKEGM